MFVEGRESELGVARFMVEVSPALASAMELITILNRCHRFQGFVYQHARFTPDVDSLNTWRPPRFIVWYTMHMALSARNQLPGSVEEVPSDLSVRNERKIQDSESLY